MAMMRQGFQNGGHTEGHQAAWTSGLTRQPQLIVAVGELATLAVWAELAVGVHVEGAQLRLPAGHDAGRAAVGTATAAAALAVVVVMPAAAAAIATGARHVAVPVRWAWGTIPAVETAAASATTTTTSTAVSASTTVARRSSVAGVSSRRRGPVASAGTAVALRAAARMMVAHHWRRIVASLLVLHVLTRRRGEYASSRIQVLETTAPNCKKSWRAVECAFLLDDVGGCRSKRVRVGHPKSLPNLLQPRTHRFT